MFVPRSKSVNETEMFAAYSQRFEALFCKYIVYTCINQKLQKQNKQILCDLYSYLQRLTGCIVRMKKKNQQCQQVGPDAVSSQNKIGIMFEKDISPKLLNNSRFVREKLTSAQRVSIRQLVGLYMFILYYFYTTILLIIV